MKRNSLIMTNSYLRDSKKREEMIVNFAYSAGRNEGLIITLKDTRKAYQTALSK